MATLSELTDARELFRNLTLRELRGKYKRSTLGWAWSLRQPAGDDGDLHRRLPLRAEDRPSGGRPQRPEELRLLPALRPAAVELPRRRDDRRHGACSRNANLIKKVYFPREILVGRGGRRRGRSSSLIELGVLAVALLVAGNFVLPWLPCVVLAARDPDDVRLGLAPRARRCSTCTSATCSTSSGSCCSCGSTPRPVVYRSELRAATSGRLRLHHPVQDALRAQPDGALHRGVPRPALRPALPAGRRLAYIAGVGRR